MNYEEKERLRMDFILDLRNGRYNVTFKDVMDMLETNDKPLIVAMVSAHEKRYGKIKVHTATAEESKEYEEKRRQEVMALEKEYEEERRR